MEVLVFGAGSLGSLLGARLAGAHDVTLVGRDPHVRAVRGSGLTVEGVESFVARPTAVTGLGELGGCGGGDGAEEGGDPADQSVDGADAGGRRVDLAVVTVKTFDTVGAAEALAAADLGFDAVVSLQNGMGNEETLAARLAGPVVAGTTTLGARLRAPGRVAWLGRGKTTVGPWTDDAGDAADLVATAFDAAGIPCERVSATAVERVLWGKLAVNAAINPVTALARVPNGAVAEPPLADVARAAAAETARVARSRGVSLGSGEAVDRAIDVARRTSENRSSMHQDVAGGRRTEVDSINGYVVDRAPADESVPVNTVLAGLVRGWERGQGLR